MERVYFPLHQTNLAINVVTSPPKLTMVLSQTNLIYVMLQVDTNKVALTLVLLVVICKYYKAYMTMVINLL
jgi:hypothetical protein